MSTNVTLISLILIILRFFLDVLTNYRERKEKYG